MVGIIMFSRGYQKNGIITNQVNSQRITNRLIVTVFTLFSLINLNCVLAFNNGCPTGFQGDQCHVNVDDCAGNLCENGATCIDGIGTYTCQCTPQFTGTYCSRDVDECSLRQFQCKNGATCVNTRGGYNCICVNGWTGPDCSENIDDCVGAPCQNGATCHDRVGSFHCQCPPGKTGLFCQYDDACASNPCQSGALCDTSPIDGTYVCSCKPGFKGVDCTVDINECEESGSPCEHGGTCVNIPGSFRCDCAIGFTGARCEININECDSSPCQNDGTCLDERGRYRCICMIGFTGEQCETDIDECADDPCLNGGTCSDLINAFRCLCPKGFSGARCEYNENDCSPHRCLNGGSCYNSMSGYTCHCPPGFTGRNCAINIDECSSSPCHNGKCIDGINGFNCSCEPGYTGRLCQNLIKECLSNPCLQGGTCRELMDGYECECLEGTSGLRCEVNDSNCPIGFKGKNCEINIDDCRRNGSQSACLNGGTCYDRVNNFTCFCPLPFTGRRCETEMNPCTANRCRNGATCTILTNFRDYQCTCQSGFTGHHCEHDINECLPYSNPCRNGATCINTNGSYQCLCPRGYEGRDCLVNTDDCASNPCRNGGSCIDLVDDYRCICADGYTGSKCENKGNYLDCSAHPCHPECPLKNECFLGFVKPWANCSTPAHCWLRFGDGKCNEECNNRECLLDGLDCRPTTGPTRPTDRPSSTNDGSSFPTPPRTAKCDSRQDFYCTQNYDNGYCDKGCDSEECVWDGLDCDEGTPLYAKGSLLVTIDSSYDELVNHPVKLNSFLRDLSRFAGAVLKVKVNDRGEQEINPVEGRNGANWSTLSLVVDNRKCQKDCFADASVLAGYLAALESRTKELSHPSAAAWSLKGIQSTYVPESNDPSLDEPSVWGLFVGCMVLVGIGSLLLVHVIIKNKVKVARGITWFPEGFMSAFASGHDLPTRNVSTYSAASGNYGRSSLGRRSLRHANRMGRSDGEEMRHLVFMKTSSSSIPSSTDTKTDTIYEEPIDPRSWSVQHYEAYGEASSECVMNGNGLMTPPLIHPENGNGLGRDGVDIIGPGGLTPLMIASAYRNSTPYCGTINDIDMDAMMMDPDSDPNGAGIIQDLLAQGADIDRTAEKTGETCLHLAARHARADAAKRLLDSGANCNATDSTGRTPLHAAIAADARGVFELLLRHRATNLNARTNDGTTPLILAARLACEGMLSDLIQAEADVNACDDKGKTALHWAASVNNVDAVRLLLRNGANRDAQDHEEATPLFLAAREGSFQAVRVLLEHYANKDITDHMDRLPRDVAAERMHEDIIELLDNLKSQAVHSTSHQEQQLTTPQTKSSRTQPFSPSNQVSSTTLPKKSASSGNYGTLKASRSRKSSKNQSKPYIQQSPKPARKQQQALQQSQPPMQSSHRQPSHYDHPPPLPPIPSQATPLQERQTNQSTRNTLNQASILSDQLATNSQIYSELANQSIASTSDHSMHQLQTSQESSRMLQSDHQNPPALPPPRNSHHHQSLQLDQCQPPQLNQNYEYITLTTGNSNNGSVCSPQIMMLSPPHSYTTNPSPINSLLSPNTPVLLSPSHHGASQQHTIVNKPPPPYEDVIKHQRTSSVPYIMTNQQQQQQQWQQNAQQTYHSIATPNMNTYSSSSDTCYLTPSPDSPETWSTTASSPPATNDWNDIQHYQQMTPNHQTLGSQCQSQQHSKIQPTRQPSSTQQAVFI